ncbi:hypothetical protein [Mycoplasma sp. 1654_15]|uniref:hypothetical protein n=1 Tax=Mycoplasma sp. 1654_15 TaxID=2725994 RepID=UPI0015806514|nr:hypothetical protein [Mycoplasma sp. 1654_15]QKG28152.1 hypothetical protein HF996_00390 [Mycoplasma sp. 1654_15]
MKKILFDLGNLSQIPSIVSPIYQYANINIDKVPQTLQVQPLIDGTISDYIPISKSENLIWDAKVDEYFEQVQDVIQFVDFSQFKETEILLNSYIKNFSNNYEKNKFKEEFYKNLNLIKNKQIDLTEIKNQYAQYLKLNLDDEDQQTSTYDNFEDQDNENLAELYNQNDSNLNEKITSNKNVTNKDKEKLIEEALNDPEVKDKFLKLKNETQDTLKKFNYFVEKYQTLYDINHGLNITSAVIAGVSWALVFTYSISSFWTFGATAPLAAGAALQSSIMTYFVHESFETERAMKADLDKIKEFKNSSEYQKIRKFSGMTYNEFKGELKKELLAKVLDFSFVYNVLNFATKTSAIRKLAKFIVDKLYNKVMSKILGKFVEEKAIKEIIMKSVFKKTFFGASKVLEKMGISIGLKRSILLTTSFANPLGVIINIMDNLVSGISVVSTIAITYQIKRYS